jgi:hypothetical protein
MTKDCLRRIARPAVLCGLLVLSVGDVQAQGPKPLTKSELLKLCRDQGLKDRPDLIIDNFIRVYGISFFPTAAILTELKNAQVQPDIIKELQKPETYSRNIAVRVCRYTKPSALADTEEEFGQRLRQYLSDAKLEFSVARNWPLLEGIPFDPGVGPPECFDHDHPRQPYKSYVTVSGSMHSQAGQPLVDTVFTFYGAGEADAKPLRETLRDLPASSESAKTIIWDAMTALERMISADATLPVGKP